jgi:hypothetical protein
MKLSGWAFWDCYAPLALSTYSLGAGIALDSDPLIGVGGIVFTVGLSLFMLMIAFTGLRAHLSSRRMAQGMRLTSSRVAKRPNDLDRDGRRGELDRRKRLLLVLAVLSALCALLRILVLPW